MSTNEATFFANSLCRLLLVFLFSGYFFVNNDVKFVFTRLFQVQSFSMGWKSLGQCACKETLSAHPYPDRSGLKDRFYNSKEPCTHTPSIRKKNPQNVKTSKPQNVDVWGFLEKPTYRQFHSNVDSLSYNTLPHLNLNFMHNLPNEKREWGWNGDSDEAQEVDRNVVLYCTYSTYVP